MQQPSSLQDALNWGLSQEEYGLIQTYLQRIPNITELAMFSGMWSEHCSYKNSILLLKTLYSESPRLLAEAGTENAGVLQVTHDKAIVFKVESHNHPSALEPYQGAATGVGGIMRDIITMGARPIGSLNSLRFGMLDEAHNRFLVKRVVQGIADYGNSLGIACMGGEVFFHPSYSANPLVNAMVIGLVSTHKIVSSKIIGDDHLVLYAGAKTGRDGIHGASFASKSLDSFSEQERSAIQVGDPFMEKLLMEASLECIDKELIVAMQDMGAAGLISSSSEMASVSNKGMRLDLDKIPMRESNMQPFEIILSESQERMLLVVEPKNVALVNDIFQKWELDAVVVGQVLQERNLKIYYHENLYAEVDPAFLTEQAPRYQREIEPPPPSPCWDMDYNVHAWEQAIRDNDTNSLRSLLTDVVTNPNFASLQLLHQQYDTDIGLRRVIGPGNNVGVIRLEGDMGISATVDGNGYYVSLDPYKGAQHSVAEAFRNLVSCGAEPIGITNCLNFGNPYDPQQFYMFHHAVKGMSDAAKFFQIPITGGNVSLYNESRSGETNVQVLPTPVIGMVGLHYHVNTAITAQVCPGLAIYLVGYFDPEIRSSLFRWITQEKSGPLPILNLQYEKDMANCLLAHYEQDGIFACIDLSSGGLLYALLRMLFISYEMHAGCIGFNFEDIDNITMLTKRRVINYDTLFWGETAHTYLVAMQAEKTMKIEDDQMDCVRLGTVTNTGTLRFTDDLAISLQDLQNEYTSTFKEIFQGVASRK